MVNADFSISLRHAESFSFDEVIFLRCGLEPLKRQTKSLEFTEDKWIYDGSQQSVMKYPTYFLTKSEYRDVLEMEKKLDEKYLNWGGGHYHHANPEIVNQQVIPSAHYESYEAQWHDQFMNFFNRTSGTAQQILKIRIDGFKLSADYLAILESLQVEMLIPQYFRDDIAWFEFICKKVDRDLTGEEVEAIRRASACDVDGQSFNYYKPRDWRISKGNIATYLAANKIESVFDFGQSTLKATDILTKPRIEAALKKHNNVRTKAADELGVSRQILSLKIKEFAMNVPAGKTDPTKNKNKTNFFTCLVRQTSAK
jgi:DNA-binding protein Fis